MAVLNPTAYRTGDSTLHRMDPRFKLVGLVLVSLTCLQGQPPGLLLLTVLTATGLATAAVPLGTLLRELRWMWLLLLLIVLSRALFTDGPESFSIPLLPVSLSLNGAIDGGLIAWRLVIIILCGILLTSTTRSTEISAAVAWSLGPVPLVNGRRMATMMGLILRFIPEILRQASLTGDALKARGIELRRNPVRRVAYTAIPVLRKVAGSGDNLAMAMEARCYSDNRTPPALQARGKDWLTILVLVVVCSAAVVI